MAEHSYNWFTELFRHWEIDNRGVRNIHGIKRAPIESVMRSVQIYFDCLICGFITYYIITNKEQVEHYPIMHFCIIMDGLVTLFLPGYVYISQIAITANENFCRIVTLSMFQYYKMRDGEMTKKERRQKEAERQQAEQKERIQRMNLMFEPEIVMNVESRSYEVDVISCSEKSESDLETPP